MRGRGFSAGLLLFCAASTVVLSAQSKNFESEKGRLHQEAVKARAAIGIDLLDPRLEKLHPYSQITPVKVQKLMPGASAAVALSGTFPPGVAVLSDRDGAVLSAAALTASNYTARVTVGATEGPGFVKLWAITPVRHVWSTMPVVFIDAVYRFDLKSPNGYTVKVTPIEKSFTLDDRFASLKYRAEFYKTGESAPFQTREGTMRYQPSEDTRTRLDIEMPEPESGAAKELNDLMQKMNDPKLTDAQRNDVTVRMVQAQQRMMDEMMKADPAAARKKVDDFGCRMLQVYPGPGGTIGEANFVCGKNFNGGVLRTTGTMTQVK